MRTFRPEGSKLTRSKLCTGISKDCTFCCWPWPRNSLRRVDHSRECLQNLVWTFSGVCLPHMNNVAWDYLVRCIDNNTNITGVFGQRVTQHAGAGVNVWTPCWGYSALITQKLLNLSVFLSWHLLHVLLLIRTLSRVFTTGLAGETVQTFRLLGHLCSHVQPLRRMPGDYLEFSACLKAAILNWLAPTVH